MKYRKNFEMNGLNKKAAEAINTLSRFCGVRDVACLDRHALQKQYGFDQADVFVLFGGSVIAGGDILARAIRDRAAKTFIIAGGEGHTTETLRKAVHKELPGIDTEGLPEAEIFQRYLQENYSCEADFLEIRSTNCGNNITYMLDLLKEKGIGFASIILCQDATMQKRMDAGLRKYFPSGLDIINFASYRASVDFFDGNLQFSNAVHGMWDMDRYVNLLMGEIPRLQDNENGYGPKGKGFIAHVDIPENVMEAFEYLKTVYGETVRAANPLFASR